VKVVNEKGAISIGTSIDRVDGREKVLGRALYAADHPISNVTYATLVQSEIPHGIVNDQAFAEAIARVKAAPGVLYVLWPGNCPPLKELPADLTDDLPLERRPPLSDWTVQHVGQHLALVVADSPENATQAASLLQVCYEALPPVLSALEASKAPVDPTEKGWVRHGSYLPDHFVKLTEEKLQDKRGEAHPESEAARLRETYATPIEHHYPIELSSTIALWDSGTLTVYDSTRWIVGSRKTIASYLDLPEDRVIVISPFVGGSFGSKAFLWQHVVLVAVAARALGRPVKLVLTRAQMFTSVGHRPVTIQELTLAADDAGLIATTEHHTVSETSTVGQFNEPVGLSSRFLYRSPHMEVSHRIARVNSPTPCFMRGPGEAPGLFALESAMDELACRLRIDPLELRVRNYADSDQASGKPWSSNQLLECYRQGAERFGWSGRSEEPRSMTRNGLRIGWGMATATYPGRRMSAGTSTALSADRLWAENTFATHKSPVGCRAGLGTDGIAQFASATHEIGNGVRTVMTQIAADASGLPLDRIVFHSGDSRFPDAPYSGASQTTATVGSAVFEAASALKTRLVALATLDPASPLFGLLPEQLDVKDGWIVSRATPAVREHYLELIRRTPPPRLEAALSFITKSSTGEQDKVAIQSFGAHFCEVEVDEEIGRARVTRWVGVFDCGRILNPKLARSQIVSGITFGLGMALMEQGVYDPATALPLAEYYVPTHADVPEFDISFVEFPDFHLNSIGARGVGEIGICGVPGAIANAIFHATGKRFRDLPVTAEGLMKSYE
jgi:xanthine dehydrogenase YagR molybdenum-binding subunit